MQQPQQDWNAKALEMLSDVEAATCLHDWGDKDGVAATLALALKSISEIPFPLSSEFIPWITTDIKNHLSFRLKIVKEINDTPTITQIPIKNPVFIIGPARSGSTLLQNLIAQDPLTRSPRLWEMKHPTSDISTAQRIAVAEAYVRETASRQPKFFAMHHIAPMEPEECTQVLACDLFYVPLLVSSAFASYFFAQPFQRKVAIYKFHKQVMQLFAHQNPQPDKVHWTFKSPLHTTSIKHIREVYPDAKFIFLHRDPAEQVSSYVTLQQGYTDWMFVGSPAVKAAWKSARAKRAASGFAGILNKTTQVIEGLEKSGIPPVVHCQYEDLKRDPVKEIQRIYQELGREYTKEFHDKLQEKWNAMKTSNVPASHSLEGTGLTDEAVRIACKPYCDKYFRERCRL